MRHVRGFMKVLLLAVIVSSFIWLYVSSQGHRPRVMPHAERAALFRPAWNESAAEGDSAGSADLGGRILMRDFKHPIYSPKADAVSGEVTGTRATLDTETQQYWIDQPQIWSSADDSDNSAVKGKIYVRADKAELTPAKGQATLSGNVVAEGESFRIDTTQVTYRLQTRALHTESPVELRWFREPQKLTSKPMIVITGIGIEGDMVGQRVKIPRSPRVVINEHGGGLFSSGAQTERSKGAEPPGNGGVPRPTEPVVISCDGPLTYEHLTGNATFRDGVTVVSGEARLRCDKLVVQLQSDREGVNIRRLDAIGHSTLDWSDKHAASDLIQWQRVTQTVLLKSQDDEPVVISQKDLKLIGKRMFFYQMDRRIDVDQEGRLVKTFAAVPASEGRPAKPASDLVIEWKESMSYDSGDGRALFLGGVKVTYGGSSLTAKELDVQVDQSGQGVRELTARDDVLVLMENPSLKASTVRGYGQKLTWKAVPEPKGETPKAAPAAAKGPQQDLSAVAGVFTLYGTADSPARIENGSHWIRAETISHNQATNSFLVAGNGTLHALVSEDTSRPVPEIVHVTWTKQLVYTTGEETTADFTGDVKARRTGQNVACDHLRVFFAPAAGTGGEKRDGPSLEVDRLVAEGDVRLTQTPATDIGVASEKTEAAAETPRELWVVASKRLTIRPRAKTVDCDSAGSLQMQQVARPEGHWLKITWEKQMKVDAAAGQAVFTGQTRSLLADSALVADELTVRFDDAQALQQIVGKGRCGFSRKLDPDAQGLLSVTSDEMKATFGVQGGTRYLERAIASGRVHLDEPRYELDCAQLDIVMAFKPRSEEQNRAFEIAVDHATAEGDPVVIVQKGKAPFEARGTRLLWQRNPAKGIDRYEMTGNPTVELRQHGIVMRHRKIVVDRNTNVFTTQGGAGSYTSEPVQKEDK